MVEKISSTLVTVDTESDWGGRQQDIRGIEQGTPIILELLKKYEQKAIFFISTELIPRILPYIEEIKRQGHYLGAHGHFHVCYKEAWRAELDKHISVEIIREIKDPSQKLIFYRAPKFSYRPKGEPFASPTNHIGLLKAQFYRQKYRAGQILYFHPFDIVGEGRPPNLFCRVWYSKPKEALKKLESILADIQICSNH